MLDHLRALLITLHLVGIVAAALPAPRGMQRKDLEEPSIQPAIEAWRGVAGALGWDISSADFREWLFTTGGGLLDARRRVLSPFQPYFRCCGTRQGWAMFSYINHDPARLEIHLDRGRGWEPLYIARTDEHDWRRAQFDQERFRALVNAFSWKQSRRHYNALAAWIARQAAAEFPDAAQVQVQMRRRPLPSPRKLRESGELTHGEAFWTEVIALR